MSVNLFHENARSPRNSEWVSRMREKAGELHASMIDENFRFFHDPPEQIQRAFGGREWFWRTGAVAVHRIGLLRGLGWKHLDGQMADFMNYVRITAEEGKPTYLVEVGRNNGLDSDTFDVKRSESGVPEAQLLATYERLTA
jgi:hypothetical protein